MPPGVRLGVALVFAALAAGGCGSEPESGPLAVERPNIVVFLTDDQDSASAGGMPHVQELLAARGTTFANSFASLPLCCPSRATLLTGQYAHNHGVWSNKPPDGGYTAFRARGRTLGVWLQDAGYRTAWIGKYLNGYGLDGDPAVPPGWDSWFSPLGLDSLLMYGYSASVDGRVREFGHEPRDYQTDVLARRAAAFVSDAGDEPLFLVVAPLAPHDEADRLTDLNHDPRPALRHRDGSRPEPPPRPAAFNARDVSGKPPHVRRPRLDADARRELRRSVRDRALSLRAVDEAVARIVRTLERTGRLEDTVVVFTSDNGYLLGEHRMVGGKSLPYRGIAGVPLIVRGPGFPEGVTSEAVVANVDLAPTFAALAGAEPTRELDGRSLAEASQGEHEDRALLLEGEGHAAVRTRDFLYVEHRRGGRELYDLRADPAELENLAGTAGYSDAEATLRDVLGRLRDCAGAACRVAGGGP